MPDAAATMDSIVARMKQDFTGEDAVILPFAAAHFLAARFDARLAWEILYDAADEVMADDLKRIPNAAVPRIVAERKDNG